MSSSRSRPRPSPVHYTIRPEDLAAHLFRVTCTIAEPAADGETLALPAWIPGSYLIRDFARHIVALTASADGQPVAAGKIAKDRWRVVAPPGSERLVIDYQVYAWDLSVRGAHLDDTHAFFNGSSVFLRVEGRESLPCRVDIQPPPGAGAKAWRVATALAAEKTKADGFGHYLAADYAELIDHPVEIGDFDHFSFRTRGVDHDFVLTGRHHADLGRLKRDLKTICDWQLRFWGKPAPTPRYVFLVTAVGDGYGGLEHRASTALLCSRDDLPKPGEVAVGERYRSFLGLVSHEYFHTWLVKRIRPADFAELDLQRENPTELLWLFEGFTSYYDDLALRRSGLISVNGYLACLSKTLTAVYGAPGRHRQTVAEASFDAWIKYYRPDENSPNATVSYYAKGALVALAVDLKLREASDGKASLDDLMRRLWIEHGRSGEGVAEADVRRIAAELAGTRLDHFFATAVHGTTDLPLAPLLKRFGVELEFTGGGAPSLGVRLDANEPRVTCAFAGGAAQRAGLSGGDVLVAVDGLKVTATNLDTLLAAHRVGARVEVHAFRRDELRCFAVELQAAMPKTCALSVAEHPSTRARRWRKGWLGD